MDNEETVTSVLCVVLMALMCASNIGMIDSWMCALEIYNIGWGCRNCCTVCWDYL